MLCTVHGHRGECVSYAGQREFVHLSTSEPCIISPVIDVNETQVAYGQSAIPKLVSSLLTYKFNTGSVHLYMEAHHVCISILCISKWIYS